MSIGYEEEYVDGHDRWPERRSPIKGVRVTCSPNPDYRYYAFRVPIKGHFIWHEGSGEILYEASGHPTLEALQAIPGIQGIMVWEGYQVNITKAAAFDWDEIEPAIVSVLQGHNSIEDLKI